MIQAAFLGSVLSFNRILIIYELLRQPIKNVRLAYSILFSEAICCVLCSRGHNSLLIDRRGILDTTLSTGNSGIQGTNVHVCLEIDYSEVDRHGTNEHTS